jgi:hypothetical protein
MSGAYKYRCLGRTAGGGRCKRPCTTAYSYCPIHEKQQKKPLVMEVDHETPFEFFDFFKDGDSSERVCGHSCGLGLEKCCECTDMRAAEAVPLAQRANGYCSICKPRYARRLPPPQEPAPLRRILEF